MVRCASWIFLGLGLLSSAGGCSRNPDATVQGAAAPSGSALSLAVADASASRAPAAWAHARSMSAEDLASLAAVEGASGLVAVAETDGDLRRVAIAALAFAPSQLGLPFLATRVRDAEQEEALAAARTVHALASRARSPEDWEDGAELREGVATLLVTARDEKRARPLRVIVVSALRMYADAGVLAADEIPTAVDAQ